MKYLMINVEKDALLKFLQLNVWCSECPMAERCSQSSQDDCKAEWTRQLKGKVRVVIDVV